MDGFALDGIWLASIVAAAGTGWIAGRWGEAAGATGAAGALRDRMPPGAQARGAASAINAAKVEPGENAARISSAVAARLNAPVADSGLPGAGDAVCPFDGMPPVESVRAQAEAIRREANLWKTPGLAHHVRRTQPLRAADPIDVLADYRAAIQQLDWLDEPGLAESGPERLHLGAGAREGEPIALSIGAQGERQPSSSSTRV